MPLGSGTCQSLVDRHASTLYTLSCVAVQRAARNMEMQIRDVVLKQMNKMQARAVAEHRICGAVIYGV